MSLDGKPAPDFTLPGSDGTTHKLSDFRGKTIVLYFYPKDNTSGCSKEACGFRDNYASFAGMEAVVLGVSRDSLKSHEKFISIFQLPFLLLTDPDGEVMRRYNAFGEKIMYGKKVEGVIRSTVVIGPDGIVLRHWPKVAKADQHPGEVLAFLRSSRINPDAGINQ